MKSQFIYLVCFLFLITGCNKNEEGPQEGNLENSIGLSTDTVQFIDLPDTVHILTKRLDWCFRTITVDGVKYEITFHNKKTQVEDHKFSQVCDWLTIMREDYNITLIADSNQYPTIRNFELSLQIGNNFETIKGGQKSVMWGPAGDIIGLSQKEVECDPNGGTVVINAEYSFWYINGIEVDGNETRIGWPEMEPEKEYLKKCDWLTVYVPDTHKKLELTIEPNNTGKERSFSIRIQKADYFPTIKGIQASK